jgi:single-strand DNA-binding protein
MYLNSVTLTGFLGGDAETRTTKNDVQLAVFSLATKSSWRDPDSGEWLSRTDWHRCVGFGRLAQAAALLKKGDYVHVQGQLQTREYSGSKDSEKQRITEIRISSVFKAERLVQNVELEADVPEEI